MTRSMKNIAIVMAMFTLVGAAVYAQTATHPVTITVSAFTRLGVGGAGAAGVDPTVDAVPVAFTLDGSTIAPGDDIQNMGALTDTSKHLQYTVVTAAGTPQRITVQISAGTMTPGCQVTVTPSGFGANQGASAGTVTLSGTAQNVITGIQSCFTGTAAANGPLLTYSFSVVNSTSLVPAAANSLTLTYTFL